jgi:hypothetical protein
MKRRLFSMRRSLSAVAFTYLGMAIFVTLASDVSIGSTVILGIVTAIPALILFPVSRVAGHTATWASVCMFCWALPLEAFPTGGGAPMTIVAIVLFGWPSCIVFGGVMAGTVRIFSNRRPGSR